MSALYLSAKGRIPDSFTPRPDPEAILNGPKVCVMNEYSAFDGDLFPYRFRHYKLGKLIGNAVGAAPWGIRGSLPFVDGAPSANPSSLRRPAQRWQG